MLYDKSPDFRFHARERRNEIVSYAADWLLSVLAPVVAGETATTHPDGDTFPQPFEESVTNLNTGRNLGVLGIMGRSEPGPDPERFFLSWEQQQAYQMRSAQQAVDATLGTPPAGETDTMQMPPAIKGSGHDYELPA